MTAPSARALELLGSEYDHQWPGPTLLSVANHFRHDGLDWEDYERWVRSSYFWTTYEDSTTSTESERIRILDSAWLKSGERTTFELDDTLADLAKSVIDAQWYGRKGIRARAVALAFIDFCREHNCFTRTISHYEVAKWTPGFSAERTRKGIADLVEIGFLRSVYRTGESRRSTRRYQVNLDWSPVMGTGSELVSLNVAMSSPGRLITSFGETETLSLTDTLLDHDVWSHRGLGQSVGLVFIELTEDWQDVQTIAANCGKSQGAARKSLERLYDVGLVMKKTGRPVLYRAVDEPDLDLIAGAIGATGAIEQNVVSLVARQEANYRNKQYWTRQVSHAP